MAKATFAAGCFWGVEAAFRELEGVRSATVGYTGGTYENPTYQDVCSGQTGHAEAVQIEYDPQEVSYDDLLNAFWKMHDPTTRDRQGPDIGSQYRSAIFFHDDDQRDTALASKHRLLKQGIPAVTEIVQASTFYRAEEYHQQYLAKRGSAHTGH